MIKRLLLVFGIVYLFACPLTVQAVKKAKADLLNAKGAPVGTATFSEKSNGVQLDLKVSNLSPGLTASTFMRWGDVKRPISNRLALTSILRASNTAGTIR